MNFNIKKFKLRNTPNLPQEINKPLVITIAAIVLFLILAAIISAFNVEKNAEKKPSSAITLNAANKDTALNPALKDLPQDYQDVNALEKYNGFNSKNKNDIAELKQELENVKRQDEALQNQVLKLTKQPTEKAQTPSSADSQQARSSSMFFSGVSAPQEQSGLSSSNTSSSGHISGPGGTTESTNTANQTLDPEVMRLSPSQQAAYYRKKTLEMQRTAVLKANDNPEDIYDLHNIVTPASPYEIQAGTIIPAVLITAVNTSTVGTVIAQVKQDMYDSVTGRFLLVPKGSKVLGEYEARVAYGQERVLISFTRVIRPNGSSILLGKPNAADLQGEGGLEGKTDNHWGRILGAATLSTLLSVGAGVASDRTTNNNNNYQSAGQGAILGAASSIAQTGQNITNRALDIQPTITLPAGYDFDIIVRRDMVLTPYRIINN